MDKWTMTHLDDKILFSAEKKWAIKPYKTWKNLKCILLSKISHYEKVKYCIIPIKWHPRKDKTTEAVKRSVVIRDWRRGRGIGGSQRILGQ